MIYLIDSNTKEFFRWDSLLYGGGWEQSNSFFKKVLIGCDIRHLYTDNVKSPNEVLLSYFVMKSLLAIYFILLKDVHSETSSRGWIYAHSVCNAMVRVHYDSFNKSQLTGVIHSSKS